MNIRIRRSVAIATFVSALLGYNNTFACDLCSLYSASRLEVQDEGTWSVGLNNQYTEFSNSDRVKNNSVRDGQVTRSFSTTYLTLGYDVSDSFGVQALVPFIRQEYEKIDGYRHKSRSESGIGDSILTASYSPVQLREANYTFLLGLFGGVKFPTGDTGNLQEVGDEEKAQNHFSHLRHHTLATIGNGRALTLGTGSYDFPVGISLFSRYDRYIFLATTQYTFRTEGDFGYRFANDFVWDAGPGYYLSLDHELTTAARLSVSGEHKPSDKQNGLLAEDSNISNIYIGPQLLLTVFESLSIEATVQGRVSRDNSEGVLPTWRARTGFTYRF